MVRGTASALSAAACVACLLHNVAGFVVGPTPTARGSFTRVNRASSATAVSRASGSLAPVAAARTQVGHASTVLRSSSAGREMTMAAGGKKTCIITGASSGIGLEGAKFLAASGDWHVILAVRSFAKAEAGAKDLGMDPSTYTVMNLDLASLNSVRNFVAEIKAAKVKPDALVCNAAVWHPKDKKPRRTADGFEEAIGVNHLGHFLLVNLLIDELKQSRVVFIGTETHNPGSIAGKIPPQAHLGDLDGLAKNEPMVDGVKYEPTKAYKDSKVCNVLMMREMDKRYSSGGMVVSALFPGCIAESPLFREKRGWFRAGFPVFQKFITKQLVSVEEAGRRVADVVSSDKFSSSGTYWRWNGQDAEATARENVVSDEAMDEARCEKLWQISSDLVGI
ncbi:unnamed protein product [Ectocarpus sp. CCAP 1310/34]|nr:unnamed protein product [Ectocarpus sp. CCAP 1310/34]